MSAPTVEQILADLDSRHEKTAAAQPAAEPASPDLETHRQALDNALGRLTSEPKTAAAESPLEGVDAVAYLEKTAAEIEAAEANALVKEAELFAGAFFHSFLNHANEYASAAGTKVAAQQDMTPQPQPTVEDQVKVAAHNGASDTQQVLQAYAQTKTASVEDQVKVAAHNGAEDMQQVLQASAQPDSNFADGVNDTIEKIASLCHDSFNRGFADIEAVVSQ